MKKRFFIVLAAAGFAAAALIYIYFTEEGAGAGIPCPFYALTGLYCPGCGASRALRSLLHLDFSGAFRYNAVFTLFAPFAAVYAAALAVGYVKSGKDKISARIPEKPLWIFAAAAIIYGILRNIPFFAFLAPTVT